MDTNLPPICKMVDVICKKHANEKGIVHTHTFKITQKLKQVLGSDRRFLSRRDGMTNEHILRSHTISTNPTVLISPSLGFGTDLADDAGRFTVVMKAPYLPLGPKRIKRLAKEDPEWYKMKTLVHLIQMCGRTTRNKNDHSVTYILDANATRLIQYNKSKLPKYFIDRLK